MATKAAESGEKQASRVEPKNRAVGEGLKRLKRQRAPNLSEESEVTPHKNQRDETNPNLSKSLKTERYPLRYGIRRVKVRSIIIQGLRSYSTSILIVLLLDVSRISADTALFSTISIDLDLSRRAGFFEG